MEININSIQIAIGIGIFLISSCSSSIVDFEQVGGVPDLISEDVAWKNGELMNITLNSLQEGDIFLIPNKTFYLMGGIKAFNITSVVFQLDGTLLYSNDTRHWPKDSKKAPLHCMQLNDISNVTFTSSGIGTFDGNGRKWWGIPGIGYLRYGKKRPHLLKVKHAQNLLFENLLFTDSPRWNLVVFDVNGLEVRYTDIYAKRRDKAIGHDLIELTAFNTDGFNVSGKNIWIHDCNVWNQDDCIAVKDHSENMLFERIQASGMGLAIGSISDGLVNNITFRDIYMNHTFKGIYMKFKGSEEGGDEGEGATISNVLYENIYMDQPEQWAIWIGPAQQAVSRRLCNAAPCSLCWPDLEKFGAKCNIYPKYKYSDILLKNITIFNPTNRNGMGVILANETTPMENIVFDGVRVIGGDETSNYYHTCSGVTSGIAIGDTYPVPDCFEDETIYGFK